MPAQIICIKYDEVGNISKTFNTQGGEMAGMGQNLKSIMQQLQDGDWIGVGADKFYEEMEEEILPAIQRLSQAMEESSKVTKQIDQLMHETDEECAKQVEAVQIEVTITVQ